MDKKASGILEESAVDHHPGRKAPLAPAGQKGFTLWFTGLPCSGKTTICEHLAPLLRKRNIKFEALDGDVVRTNLSKGLGFSQEDRDINIRRIGFVCNLLTRNGIMAIGAAISPYRSIRQENRDLIQHFVEVYVKCPVEECERRDVKGMYAKARAGLITQFTGVDDPYEPPEHPEIICDTMKETPGESANHIIDRLIELEYLTA